MTAQIIDLFYDKKLFDQVCQWSVQMESSSHRKKCQNKEVCTNDLLFCMFALAHMVQFKPVVWKPELRGSIQVELLGPVLSYLLLIGSLTKGGGLLSQRWD